MSNLFTFVQQKTRNAIRDIRNGSMLWQKIKHHFRVRTWTPVALQVLLIVVVGNYTASKSDAFLSDYNLRSLLLTTLPLALVTMAQVNALLAGYLDISVGSVMTIGGVSITPGVTTGVVRALRRRGLGLAAAAGFRLVARFAGTLEGLRAVRRGAAAAPPAPLATARASC